MYCTRLECHIDRRPCSLNRTQSTELLVSNEFVNWDSQYRTLSAQWGQHRFHVWQTMLATVALPLGYLFIWGGRMTRDINLKISLKEEMCGNHFKHSHSLKWSYLGPTVEKYEFKNIRWFTIVLQRLFYKSINILVFKHLSNAHNP